MGIFETLNESTVKAENITDDKNLVKSFNTGLAKSIGLPGDVLNFLIPLTPQAKVIKKISELVFTDGMPDISLPGGRELQQLAADLNLGFAAGQEPDGLASRLAENVGATAPFLPLVPLLSTGTATAVIITELSALFGSSFLGKTLEQDTEFGQKHPLLARALGEGIGGLGGPSSVRGALAIGTFLIKGGGTGALFRFVKNIFPSGKAAAEAKTAAREFDIDRSLKNLEEARKDPNLRILPAATQEDNLGAARLQKTVMAENAKAERIINRQNEIATNKLQKRFIGEGNIDDARQLIQRNVDDAIAETSEAFSRLETSGSPANITQVFREKMGVAFDKSDANLNKIWNDLPSGVIVEEQNSALIAFYDNLLADTTTGAGLDDIDSIIKNRLGAPRRDAKSRTFKRGKGTLFESDLDAEGLPINLDAEGLPIRDTSVKSLHGMYSVLGRKAKELSQQRGQGNKIRIINEAREAILEDLANVSVLPEYKEAFKITTDHHNKFTKGAIGDMLGFGRGDTPLEGKSLSLLLANGGEDALANIKQALNADPGTKQSISDFLTSQFVLFAKNDQNNKIDVFKGRQFIKKFEDTFDELLPELKTNLNDVINKQKDVDFLSGASQVIDASPQVRETSASAFLLGSDPGEEIGRLISTKNINRTNFAKSLVADVSKDKSGKALKGLQSAFAENLFNSSLEEGFINARKLKSSLADLKKVVLSSKMFTPEEFKNLEGITEAFRRMQFVRGVAPFTGGIINNLASKLIAIPAGGIGAVAGAKLASAGGIGGSLRGANIGAGEVREFLTKLTNREARTLLIRSVFDKGLRIELLKNARTLNAEQQRTLVNKLKDALGSAKGKIKDTAKATIRENIPIVGLAPAATSLGSNQGQNRTAIPGRSFDLINFLDNL